MSQKVTIKKIGRKEIQTKVGPKFNLSICDENGKWYSGWPTKETANWKEGQTVEIDVTEKNVGDKTYYNFTPKQVSPEEVLSVCKEILTIVKALAVKDSKPKKKEPPASKEFVDEDIPPPDEFEPPAAEEEMF